MLSKKVIFPGLLPDFLPLPDDGVFDIFGNPQICLSKLK